MSIDRARHLTGSGAGLTAGSDDSLRDRNGQARERRAPSDGAAESFANLMQSGREGQQEQDGQRDGERPAAHLAFPFGLQGEKYIDQHIDKHVAGQAPLPDVFSLFAPAPAPAPTPLADEMTTLITSSLLADDALADVAVPTPSTGVPVTPVTVDALRVNADGGHSIEIDVGSQSPALTGLTVRLAECDGRLQIDFLARDTPLFERLAREAESIAQKLRGRLTRAVLVRVEQIGGGTSSPVESLAS